MTGFIKGKTPAGRAWVRGCSTTKNFQDSSGDLPVMTNCDWLNKLHPVSHKHEVFGAPDANQPRR